MWRITRHLLLQVTPVQSHDAISGLAKFSLYLATTNCVQDAQAEANKPFFGEPVSCGMKMWRLDRVFVNCIVFSLKS
jgi:hypothetical protein